MAGLSASNYIRSYLTVNRLVFYAQRKNSILVNENTQKEKYDPELFAALTDGLPRESLEQLRNGLATGDPDTYEHFGLNGEENDGNEREYTRTRKK